MQQIMQYLRENGQRLDSEIAAATRMPLRKVRDLLTDLSAKGKISRCSFVRFNDGKKIEGTVCRVIGYIPPKSPGRKPAA